MQRPSSIFKLARTKVEGAYSGSARSGDPSVLRAYLLPMGVSCPGQVRGLGEGRHRDVFVLVSKSLADDLAF